MKCDNCGRQIGNRIYRYNNSYLCPECARSLGVSDMISNTMSGAMGAMKFLDSEILGVMPQVFNGLEFSPTRTQIKCPKCGTTLKEFESTGLLGCIECYNTFNDQIMRSLMKTQGNTEYIGRAPGVKADTSAWKVAVDNDDSEMSVESTVDSEHKNEDKLLRYENSDIGMLSDEDLKEAIKLAVEAENYLLAARFRDELKGREDN